MKQLKFLSKKNVIEFILVLLLATFLASLLYLFPDLGSRVIYYLTIGLISLFFAAMTVGLVSDFIQKTFSFLWPPKPQLCDHCHKPFPKLTDYHTAPEHQRKNDKVLQLCTSCLFLQLQSDLLKQAVPVIMFSPEMEEGYVFEAFDHIPASRQRYEAQPISSYIPSEADVCQQCQKPAQVAWLTTDVYTFGSGKDLFRRYLPKTEYQGTVQYLCFNHATDKLKHAVLKKRIVFDDFWSIQESGSGFFN